MDLRQRVGTEVVAGASRWMAAARFRVSASSARPARWRHVRGAATVARRRPRRTGRRSWNRRAVALPDARGDLVRTHWRRCGVRPRHALANIRAARDRAQKSRRTRPSWRPRRLEAAMWLVRGAARLRPFAAGIQQTLISSLNWGLCQDGPYLWLRAHG